MKTLPSEKMKFGVARAPQRSLLKAMGHDDTSIAKPLIGIASSFSELVPGHIHLDKLAAEVKRGIEEAGGTGLIFNTIAICDGIAMGHEGMRSSLPSREIIADSVELMASAHALDGLVLVASCDKIVPGMLMAAARLNLPAVMLTGGPMAAGSHQGRTVDLISVFEAVAKVENGKMSAEELSELEGCACPGAGSCAGLFTANTMACMAEALGLALPGGASALATSDKRLELAFASGQAVMVAVEKDIKPSDVLDSESFHNACVVDLALGGSTNTCLHLPAMAHEAGVDFGLKDFDRLSGQVPQLCALSPSGPMHMEDLDAAGGVGALMARLSGLLKTDALTVSGQRLQEVLPSQVADCLVDGAPVIASREDPVRTQGGLAVLWGSLAPEGAVVKAAAVNPEMMIHQGPARVFECEEDALAAVNAKDIVQGEVLVVRGEGPAGGPGMREMLALTSLISGGPLDGVVALITDGRFSGGSRGAAIGHVSPEAARGGVIGLIQDGDAIAIDIPARTIELLVPSQELEGRRPWQPPAGKTVSGYLARYAAQVTSAATGAVLKTPTQGEGK